MMLKFEKSKPDDFLAIARNSTDDLNDTLPDDLILKQGMNLINSGVAFTGLLNGQIICIAGIQIKRQGVGHIWSMFSKETLKLKITVFRSIKIMLDCVIKNFEIHKIQSESRKGFEQSQRLLEHLGFVRQRRDMNKNYYFYLRNC